MKKPQPDIQAIAVGRYVNSAGSNRKLRRLWGTTMVQGVEVFNSRRHYHKASDKPTNHEVLFRFLGVDKDIEDYDGAGLKSAWFTFNKSKGPESGTVDPSFVADNLNRMWWDDNDGVMPADLTLTTSIVIGEHFDTREGLSGVNWNLPKEDLIQSIVDNYDSFWINNEILQEGIGVINKGTVLDPDTKLDVPDEDDLSPDDPWLAILSRYALRTSGITCTIKDVEVGIGGGQLSYNPGRVYNTAVVTIEIPYHEFLVSDNIVTRIMEDIDTDNFPLTTDMYRYNILNSSYNARVFSNEHVTQDLTKQITFYETVDDIDDTTISRDYISWEDGKLAANKYDGFWLKDGSTWYLKAEVVSDPKLYNTTQNELNTYLFSILDTGYKKKKVSFWKKLVAIVVFIVAAVLTVISVGTTSGFAAYAFAVAQGIMAGALALSIVGAIFAAVGMTDMASAFASVSAAIEPLVMVASIIMVVDVVGVLGQQISDQGVSAVFDKVLSEFTMGLSDVVTDIAAGGMTGTQILSSTSTVVKAYTKVRSDRLTEISSKNKDLKAEYEGLLKEAEQEADAMQGFMRIYSKPATADWSIYAATYDTPHERGGGVMAMGNIQKTTKQAMRKADYKEPMFEGMIFV